MEDKERASTSAIEDSNNNKSLLENYSATLTSFGVKRIKNGRTFEKIIWIIGILAIIIFTVYTLYRNTVRYLAYDVKTEIKIIEKVERYLPVITFCWQPTIYGTIFCYKNDSFDYNYACKNKSSKKTTMRYWEGGRDGRWVEGRYIGNDCHVFNENGTMSMSTGTDYLDILFDALMPEHEFTNRLLVTFQTPSEFANRKETIYVTNFNQNMVLARGEFEIRITEKQTTRLPYPYTSDCIDGNLVSNQFSDQYTYDSCREKCAYDYMLNKCHDVIDLWKKYPHVEAETENSTLESRRKCINEVTYEMARKASSLCTCKRACNEITYTVQKKEIDYLGHGTSRWALILFLEDPVTEIKLTPDFPSEQFFGTFGGVFGLGGKFQVVFQVCVFIFLCTVNLFARNR